jgi:hypothetical protein
MSRDNLGAAHGRYVNRGWTTVPIPAGQKGPTEKAWQTRNFTVSDFAEGGNIGLILGPRSGEMVDIDLDCPEALGLADIYLPPTGAEFGRASKPRSHRLYVAPGAQFESFPDPLLKGKSTLLELRARGRDGASEHQTVFPPSVHPSGEAIEWHGDIIAPTGYEARKLRRRCAFLAMACLLARYVSQHAAERPGPDFSRLLWEADHTLGRVAYRWLGHRAPDEPHESCKTRHRLTREEIDLAEVVNEIPNNEDWHGWNRIGLAIYGASGGSDQGGIVFDDWSAKSPKYDPYVTSARWRHYHRSPPDRIGLGTLIHLARGAGWQRATEKRRA